MAGLKTNGWVGGPIREKYTKEPKTYFDLQTPCIAHICWLKYTIEMVCDERPWCGV